MAISEASLRSYLGLPWVSLVLWVCFRPHADELSQKMNL